jgi:hypothetical protein
MKKIVAGLILVTAWLQLTVTTAIAQPSVYSGVYTYGEGDLTTASRRIGRPFKPMPAAVF